MQSLYRAARFLSQRHRYLIIQTILGHPDALASKAEIAHFQPGESWHKIGYHLDRLVESGIFARYIHEPNEYRSDYPATFYGPTTYGVLVLGTLGYLQSVPMIRALHERTRKPAYIIHHREAPRPTLPLAVRYALRLDEYSLNTTNKDSPA
jgi:hypothetical protein